MKVVWNGKEILNAKVSTFWAVKILLENHVRNQTNPSKYLWSFIPRQREKVVLLCYCSCIRLYNFPIFFVEAAEKAKSKLSTFFASWATRKADIWEGWGKTHTRNEETHVPPCCQLCSLMLSPVSIKTCPKKIREVEYNEKLKESRVIGKGITLWLYTVLIESRAFF